MMNYAGLWALFGYSLGWVAAVIVLLAVWAWRHRTEGGMEIDIDSESAEHSRFSFDYDDPNSV